MYQTIVTAEPSHTVFIFDDFGSRYSAHLLDLYAVLGIMSGRPEDTGCCAGDSWAACDPKPRCNRQRAAGGSGEWQPYMEQLADRQATRTLRDAFYELAANGKMRSWITAGWGGVEIRNNGSVSVPRLKQDICKYWLDHGFGPEFWWAN